jgi:transcription elongation factor Elf1
MNPPRLCSHCQQLISSQSHRIPRGYAQVNREYNHTVYRCGACGAYFGHIHVPHRWQLMLAPVKRYDTDQPAQGSRPNRMAQTSPFTIPGIA